MNQKKIDTAIERLNMFEPEDGYILCFSGGKDSIVLEDLAKKCGVSYQSVYNVTTMDPPPITRFIHEHYPYVRWDFPEMPFWRKVGEKGLPMRMTRWCCDIYKENTFTGKVKLLGVREDEGRISGEVRLTRVCNKTGEQAIQPIFDWTDKDIWDYINSNNLPYCKLYDEGWNRIGCMCCPFASKEEKLNSMDKWPTFFKAIRKGVRIRWNTYWIPKESPVAERFNSADDLFEWWIQGNISYPDLGEKWKAESYSLKDRLGEPY